MKTRDTSEVLPHAVVKAQDLDRSVEIIEGAAAAIDEMLQYNRTMKSVAARGVTHYRAEAEEARREAAVLSLKVSELVSEKQSMTDYYEARIDELEQRLATRERELESMRSLLWPGRDAPR